MKKKNILLISLIFISVVLISFIATIFLLREKPTLPTKATGPSCPVNTGSCSWSSDETATSFNVKIVDRTTGTTILDTNTSNKKVDFTPEAGHSYKCLVSPVNSCGEGPESTATSICTVITGTITPSPTNTLTPTSTITVTATVTSTPPPDSTPTVTPEISPTPTLTLTPIPTEEIQPTPTITLTNTPIPTTENQPTESPVTTLLPTNTPYSAPTIPESGIPASWIFIIMPISIIILGLIF